MTGIRHQLVSYDVSAANRKIVCKSVQFYRAPVLPADWTVRQWVSGMHIVGLIAECDGFPEMRWRLGTDRWVEYRFVPVAGEDWG